MTKPLVAIVGRPNVGKSTFFNKVTGKRISIVQDMPGVTRDRIYADTDWNGCAFTLVDTGGLELKSTDEMYVHIKRQAELAVEMADVILFFTDVKHGLTSADEDVARYLRLSGKPIVLVVNKLDNYDPVLLAEFYALGLGEPYGVSSEHGKGIGDVLDAVVAAFTARVSPEDEEETVRIAVVGKPNAGKSSLVNRLLGFERSIVSDVAGTTRDAIDTPFTWNGKRYTLIDTAGIRRKSKVEEDVEYYSVMRALAAVRRADVCLVVVDASEEFSEQDLKICGYVHEQGKPSVILMNKWDLVEKDTYTVNRYNDKLREALKFMDYFKALYLSAKTGKRAEKVMELVDYVYAKNHVRIATGMLNDMLADATATTEPPAKNGRRLKLYFATQVSVAPPTFVFKVNDAKLVHFSYERFLENYLRKTFELDGTPVRLLFRDRNEEENA